VKLYVFETNLSVSFSGVDLNIVNLKWGLGFCVTVCWGKAGGLLNRSHRLNLQGFALVGVSLHPVNFQALARTGLSWQFAYTQSPGRTVFVLKGGSFHFSGRLFHCTVWWSVFRCSSSIFIGVDASCVWTCWNWVCLRQKESFDLCLFTWGNARRWGHYPTWLIC
jgi:hypothetical protein